MSLPLRRATFYLAFGSAASILFSIAISQILLGLSLASLLLSGQPLRFPPLRAPLALFFGITAIAVLASGDPRAGTPQIRKFFVCDAPSGIQRLRNGQAGPRTPILLGGSRALFRAARYRSIPAPQARGKQLRVPARRTHPRVRKPLDDIWRRRDDRSVDARRLGTILAWTSRQDIRMARCRNPANRSDAGNDPLYIPAGSTVRFDLSAVATAANTGSGRRGGGPGWRRGCPARYSRKSDLSVPASRRERLPCTPRRVPAS